MENPGGSLKPVSSMSWNVMLRRPFESTLAALVGMMNYPGRAPLPERHVERLEDQFGTQISFHRPAHDPSAEDVEHHRQIEKAGPGWNVGDVGHPQTVGRCSGEVAFDQIRSGPGLAIAHRGYDPVAPAHAGQPSCAHQSRHAFDPHPNALLCKLDMNARRAVGGTRATMDLGDLRAQLGVRASACRGRAFQPRIVTAGGDAQHAARGGYRIHGLVSPYECERRDGVAPV